MAFVPDQWITVFVAQSSRAKANYAIRDWPNPGSFIFLVFFCSKTRQNNCCQHLRVRGNCTICNGCLVKVLESFLAYTFLIVKHSKSKFLMNSNRWVSRTLKTSLWHIIQRHWILFKYSNIFIEKPSVLQKYSASESVMF